MNRPCLSIPAFFLLIIMPLLTARATERVWTGSGSDSNWFNSANWNPSDIYPVTGDSVIISNSASVILSNETAILDTFTITNATLTFTNWTTILNASNVTILSGGILTLPGAFTNNAMSNRVHIVCTNFTIEAGGSINADYKGYADKNGPGKGDPAGGSGAGYGGKGGRSLWGQAGGSTYGSTNAPLAPGSGGGYTGGGYGGGAVRVEATGSATVDGTITANGGDGGSASGGGSGGGIFITCNTFGGSNGLISANGGNGAGGGGGAGGGRIAVQYQNLQGTPLVQFSASCGTSYLNDVWDCRAPQMGTLYLSNTNMLSEVLVDITGYLIIPTFTNWLPGSLTVSNGIVGFEDGFSLNIGSNLLIGTDGGLVLGTNSELTCTGDLVMTSGQLVIGLENGTTNSELTCSGKILNSGELAVQGSLTCGGNLVLTNSGKLHAYYGGLTCGGDLIVTSGGSLHVFSGMTNGLTADYGALVSVTGDVLIGSSSWIYPYSHFTNGGSVLFRMSNLWIAETGNFDADEKGYAAQNGPGVLVAGSGGAGYGGKGGQSQWGEAGGSTYGSTNAPLAPGSGEGYTGGGYGGGAVRVEATGSATVDGTITANGGDGGSASGGGSGGGIFIICKTFGGGTNAILYAKGGKGQTGGGGGGGGRIAVWYEVPEAERQRILDGDMRRVPITSEYTEFPGTVSVTNGTGYSNGVPGTIVFLTVTPPSGTMFMGR